MLSCCRECAGDDLQPHRGGRQRDAAALDRGQADVEADVAVGALGGRGIVPGFHILFNLLFRLILDEREIQTLPD